MSLVPMQANAHKLGLTIGRHAALVQLAGDIDLRARDDLTRLMDS